MKKALKLSALALAIVIICLSFCGCASLDEKRDSQAFWTEENSTDSITYNGETYKKLDKTYGQYVVYYSNNYNPINITKSDVPVLLSDTYCVSLQLSDDKNFIYGYMFSDYKQEMYKNSFIYNAAGYNVNPDKEVSLDVLYCKNSLYDSIVDRVENGIEYTHYEYEYSIYNPEEFISTYHNYHLTDNEEKVIESVIKEVEPVNNIYALENKELLCELYHLSEDNILGTYAYEIYIDDENEYYLAGWYSDHPEMAEYLAFYKVPEKYKDDFDKITECARIEYSNNY